jgi:predicted amidohydrolase
MRRQIHVAGLSIVSRKWQKQENFEKVVHFLRRAAGEGADVALTPAECLEGQVLQEALSKDREADLLALAEPVEGPFLTELRSLARDLWMNMIIGFLERIDDAVYPCALFIERTGNVAGKSHQIHLDVEGHEAGLVVRVGQSVRAFDTEVGRVGLILDEDHHDPDLARCLRLDGAQILFNPAAEPWTRKSDQAVEQRSYETGLPLIQAHPRTSLIVADGARVVKQTGQDRITSAVVSVPSRPDPALARELEREILARRDA